MVIRIRFTFRLDWRWTGLEFHFYWNLCFELMLKLYVLLRLEIHHVWHCDNLQLRIHLSASAHALFWMSVVGAVCLAGRHAGRLATLLC